MKTLIHNAIIVNEGSTRRGWVLTDGCRIDSTGEGEPPHSVREAADVAEDAGGQLLLPGAIDEHVHFRDPGLTMKADIASESRAAVAGGVTTFFDMPNTVPQTTSIAAWQQKMDRAEEVSVANYAFWIGATDSNMEELLCADYTRIPGVKVFMGSSTGNMALGRKDSLRRLFHEVKARFAVHAEDDEVIKANAAAMREKYAPGDVPVECHPLIRSREACLKATEAAIALAREENAALQVMHISTADELKCFTPGGDPATKRLTAETCVQYLWWSDEDYARLGAKMKCNPAIKSLSDRDALRKAVADGTIDVIATDHAPHLIADKTGGALSAASGIPLIQFSLPMMLTLARRGVFGMETVVEKMCHAPARIFGVTGRGFIRPGYFADLVLADVSRDFLVEEGYVLNKCGWTPLAGESLSARITATWVNGHKVWNGTEIDDTYKGYPVLFNSPLGAEKQ